MKLKRTKPFLLATAGATVDGRTIDEKMLKEMASSYDPKTYCARLNIEHVRGITGDKPFRAYGDIVSLSTQMVEVNFNGVKEQRLGLFGVFDVTEDAIELNKQNQKLYSSIEINPDFAGKGFAYCMGGAMTDSPASVATERLQFNAVRPGALNLANDDGAALEFADETGATTPEGGSFLSALTGVLEKFTGGKKEEPAAQPAQQPAAAGAFDMSTLTELFTGLGKTIDTAMQAQTNAFRGEIDQISLKVTNLAKDIEMTPAGDQQSRPLSNGQNFAVTDC